MVKRYSFAIEDKLLDELVVGSATYGEWVKFEDYSRLETEIERFQIAHDYNSMMKAKVEEERDELRSLVTEIVGVLENIESDSHCTMSKRMAERILSKRESKIQTFMNAE